MIHLNRCTPLGLHPLQTTEAKLLLATVLATRAWRFSLDLACEKASSLTAVLLEEEAVALARTTASGSTRNAVRSRLPSRCSPCGPGKPQTGETFSQPEQVISLA